jgi:hypothetical protein
VTIARSTHFGLSRLFGSFGLFSLFGFSGSNTKQTKQTRQTRQTTHEAKMALRVAQACVGG